MGWVPGASPASRSAAGLTSSPWAQQQRLPRAGGLTHLTAKGEGSLLMLQPPPPPPRRDSEARLNPLLSTWPGVQASVLQSTWGLLIYAGQAPCCSLRLGALLEPWDLDVAGSGAHTECRSLAPGPGPLPAPSCCHGLLLGGPWPGIPAPPPPRETLGTRVRDMPSSSETSQRLWTLHSHPWGRGVTVTPVSFHTPSPPHGKVTPPISPRAGQVGGET